MDESKALVELFSLAGQVVLVTGAARGLGWETARVCARAGAHVAINDLSADAVNERVRELEQAGLSSSAAVFDIRDHGAAAAAIESIAGERGRLDVVVNNAGVQNRKPFVDYTPEEWDAILTTHVSGSFNVTQAAVRQMVRQGSGRIVMIGSIAATSVKGTIVPYASAKGALIAMVRALATEYGPRGITCNAIAPGFLDTEFTRNLVNNAEFSKYVSARVPAGRWGKPGDVAPAILFLASPAGSYVNGQVITVDGGLLAAI
jgi:gluconate 5-dehydrogenase